MSQLILYSFMKITIARNNNNNNNKIIKTNVEILYRNNN